MHARIHLSSALIPCTSSITCSQVLDAPLLEPRMLRATSHLGMEMWVIQLACLHHWPTSVYCFLVGAATSNLLGHLSHRRALAVGLSTTTKCGQPLVSSRISSPSVYAQ
jgi:hypothetical protein